MSRRKSIIIPCEPKREWWNEKRVMGSCEQLTRYKNRRWGKSWLAPFNLGHIYAPTKEWIGLFGDKKLCFGFELWGRWPAKMEMIARNLKNLFCILSVGLLSKTLQNRWFWWTVSSLMILKIWVVWFNSLLEIFLPCKEVLYINYVIRLSFWDRPKGGWLWKVNWL